MEVPEIAQAVVNPYEPEPGAVEIVAYYTRKQGAPEVSSGEVAEMLRRNLPSYMVPGYLEELPLIPMTPNNKADRKALPAPKGPRSRDVDKQVRRPENRDRESGRRRTHRYHEDRARIGGGSLLP